MKKYFVLVGFVAGVLGLSGLAEAQDPSFALSVSAPASLIGDAGATLEYDATVAVTTTGLTATDPGAQGWSLSLGIEGGTLVSATTSATVDALFTGGFRNTELTTGAGNEGVVSAVVLAFKAPVTLPPSGKSDILVIKVSATVPPPGEVNGEFACNPLVSKLSFVNGREGSGEPVDNKITYKGETEIPTLGAPAITEVCPKPPPCTPEPINLGFSAANITGESTPWAGVAGTDGAGGSIVLNSPVGPTVPEKHVFADVISQLTGFGVQGWSISVGSMVGSEGTITDATYAGTIAAQAETGGFASVELINPALPENAAVNSGAVEAIVLSFKKPIVLPLTGVESVMDMKVAAAGPQTDADQVVTLKYVSGLKGSGEPVPNNFTVNGETEEACNTDLADVKVVFSKSLIAQFIRGDANSDKKVDIADPIWIINEIFKGGPATPCPDAGDANDDGQLDSSDAVYLISFQFGIPNASVAPPAPYPTCGADPTADAVECAESAPGC